ncbi:MAG: CRISPR-associated helicase Cas3' [Nitrospirae bacterium]|nr:CRISPR-associated helicase Cas3' [Nitrospirota bacterium]
MNELWAKDNGETLLEHTDNVVKVIKRLCNGLPFPAIERERLSSIALCIGGLHDIGKAASGFQSTLRGKSRWGHRHEILSVAVAGIILPKLSQEALLAIITHHRSIPASLTTENEKCLPLDELPFEGKNQVWNLMTKEWIEQWESVKDLLLNINKLYDFGIHNLPDKFGFNGLGLPEKILHRNYQRKVFGFNRRHASLLRGLLITADHIASAHQFDLPEVPVQKDYVELIGRKELKGNKIFPFQQQCAETTGNTILKSPTGSGKTAAILLWAAKNQAENSRLFYVLPHTASINAMHQRLQKIYGDKTVGVLHHKNAAYLFRLFENDYSSNDAARMAHTISGLARELYHPIRVTTPHQILRIALNGKGWELGLAEFPNACFVFDEIHAFEPLLVGLTLATVKWLMSMGARVLFASATLPSFMEKILREEVGIADENIISPDPTNEDDRIVLDKVRHKVEIRHGNLLSSIEQIINEIRVSGKTALIVCNHVATSQRVYEKLREEFKDTKLLHARFNAEDRFRIESIIQSNNPPRILVATQAVEVSLDLDYECGYIEPAPADALGQRLGRINRKGSHPKDSYTKSPAQVVIFEEPSAKIKESPLYLPYDKEVTKKTINLLKECVLLSEQSLTNIVNRIYASGYKGDSKEDYEKGLKNQMIERFDENIIAGTHKDWVESVIEGSDGQMEVLPNDLYIKFQELKLEKKYLEAKMLLVPIQTRQTRKLFQENTLWFDKQLDEYVTSLLYSSDRGLNLEKQIDNIF